MRSKCMESAVRNLLHWSASLKVDDNWLVVEPTRLKNMIVKLEIFPKEG